MIRGYEDILKEDEYEIKVFEEKSSYMRKPTKEDYLYRVQQRQEFPQKVATYVSSGEMLCFHGTDIYGAKHILESGQISSGMDRLGHHTSMDPSGKISATNKDTVDTSVGTYMNLTSDFLYPAGCLFVIKAKDKAEYDRLPSGWMIDNVDLKAHPDRLVAIVTTPENIERVNGWAKSGDIDTKKVMNFEEFIAKCMNRGPRHPPVHAQQHEKYDEPTPQPRYGRVLRNS